LTGFDGLYYECSDKAGTKRTEPAIYSGLSREQAGE
jgi:hypothetical protein